MLSSPDEGGPVGILHDLRRILGVTYNEHSQMTAEPGSLADGLICIVCNTVWLGWFFALAYFLSPTLAIALALPFALSGAGLLINKL